MSKPINRHGVNGGVVTNSNNQKSPSLLVKSLRNGDPSAFDLLVEQKDMQLKNYLFKILRSREDAEEITQDVFIHIWQNRDYLSEEMPVDGLIHNIAYKRAIDRLRERNRLNVLLKGEYGRSLDYADSPQEIAELHEIQAKIERVIEAMPAVMRRIYLMKFRDGLSNEQIAEELSITASSVRVQVSRAEKKIREAIAIPSDFQGYEK